MPWILNRAWLMHLRSFRIALAYKKAHGGYLRNHFCILTTDPSVFLSLSNRMINEANKPDMIDHHDSMELCSRPLQGLQFGIFRIHSASMRP
jgi:hypothetical protein